MTMHESSPTPGQPPAEPRSLRETKREETLRALYLSATTLVLERGYDDVTVEDICKEAHISRRTFFNYVDSKETAVFGPIPTPPVAEALDEFVGTEHANLVKATLDLLLDNSTIAGKSASDIELLRNRHAVCRQNPTITARRLSYGAGLFDVVTSTVARYLEAHPSARRIPGIDVREEAETVVGSAAAAKHLGWLWWVNTHRREATANFESAVDSLHSYAHRALDNFALIHGEDRR
ncbi:TetR/AcrR family transcriptional regulator [Corynebacterium renale]|uniref:TetR family transcriptional regulator n=1 Tax=Corynebacterium renale TaxID=1724 RepID=A0A2A9DQH7_9CORY|nr:TetR/AcrR family transcriptional regulator [Corynebacterium renale]PFG29017.1 TetR family transcriptional regulator [Corynebacterium renale]SQI25321.1 TetR family transcriptional regulator [Corynebacterium renale]